MEDNYYVHVYVVNNRLRFIRTFHVESNMPLGRVTQTFNRLAEEAGLEKSTKFHYKGKSIKRHKTLKQMRYKLPTMKIYAYSAYPKLPLY